jgi:hypothetical protein
MVMIAAFHDSHCTTLARGGVKAFYSMGPCQGRAGCEWSTVAQLINRHWHGATVCWARTRLRCRKLVATDVMANRSGERDALLV